MSRAPPWSLCLRLPPFQDVCTLYWVVTQNLSSSCMTPLLESLQRLCIIFSFGLDSLKQCDILYFTPSVFSLINHPVNPCPTYWPAIQQMQHSLSHHCSFRYDSPSTWNSILLGKLLSTSDFFLHIISLVIFLLISPRLDGVAPLQLLKPVFCVYPHSSSTYQTVLELLALLLSHLLSNKFLQSRNRVLFSCCLLNSMNI